MWLGRFSVSNESLEKSFRDADSPMLIDSIVLVMLSNEPYFRGPG